MTNRLNLKRKKWLKPHHKVNKKLKGILWDLLRLQFKVALTGASALLIIYFILQGFVTIGVHSDETAFVMLLSEPILMLSITIVFTLIFLTAAVIYSYTYASGLKRAITHIIHQLKQFQRGTFRQQLHVDRDDEVKELSVQIHHLTKDVEQQIRSMRRVLNENATLISEAERAASLEERRKLARDLHDAVSQELFAVSMSLGAMPKVIEKNPEKAKQLFQQTEKMVHHAQQELRALIMHLRPVTLEGNGLSDALESILDELRRKHPQLQISWSLLELPNLEPGVEEQLFRVIQEGISNALRHANPKSLTLKAVRKTEQLLLILEDDGIGFDMESDDSQMRVSYGLNSMEERIVELGGHFSIVSYPSKGTKLEFRIPLTENGTGGDE
ncbi:sensor histidine kinase [Bacillus shivajii]|uniref:sensor histidine kinase n=1 Tax=Bacillus shivajii TaxID=1983719 RepID=UPI001CFB4DBE|nr:sensor histidine kinase [Bacillus shivajii]UCZ51965.1 sensor histidine kinase [Bacillus shivajii]